MQQRTSSITRNTSETQISLSLNLDAAGRGKIASGSGFLDHMLDLFQVHSGTTLDLECVGDTHIDMHHSAEDIAIALGSALAEALGDKKGIERYGFYLVPMDEALARVCLDFGGRIGFVWEAALPCEVAGMPSSLWEHFFKTLSENAKMNLHISLLYGTDGHHELEAIFKAFARAVAMAIGQNPRVSGVPSSKGVL
jgi:imidazoleglycerol-phosphate dehydratase